jgi:hypothetical protein
MLAEVNIIQFINKDYFEYIQHDISYNLGGDLGIKVLDKYKELVNLMLLGS